MSPGNIFAISVELKYHPILVLKTRGVQISSQIKFAKSCLFLDLDSSLQTFTLDHAHICGVNKTFSRGSLEKQSSR